MSMEEKPKKDECETEHLKLYEIYRDYLKHEDDLINHRLTWNLTLQGLLFVGYYLSAHKLLDLKTKALTDFIGMIPQNGQNVAEALKFIRLDPGVHEMRTLLLVISGVGLAVSAIVFASVAAARIAIGEINDRWKTIPESRWLLPGITGGGRKSARYLGFWAPLSLPMIFLGVWWYLFWSTKWS